MDDKFLQQFMKKLNPTDDLFNNFYKAVISGDNKVYHNLISEAITLDDKWINTIESSLFFIEDIIKDPKKFIIDEDIVVEVERARRTTSKTIRHLSQNSKDVMRIEDDGFVMPKKVLTTQIEEDLAIYENRFICTLVQRLIMFVENQYNVINGKMHYYDITNIGMDSEFTLGRTVFNYKLALSVKEPPVDTIQLKKNVELLERIDKIRTRLQVIHGTDFIKKLSSLKPIHPPIQKTNIIKMNVNYRSCYNLWLYISAYTMVGYSIEVMDKNLPVDGNFFDDMTIMTALSIKTVLQNEKIRKFSYSRLKFDEPRKKEYKLRTDIKYIPDFLKSKEEVSDDIVNEYYFTEMKKAFKKAINPERISKSSLTTERELKMNFEKFYRSVNKISDEMMLDVIKSETKGEKSTKASLAAKQKRYDDQKLLYRRITQLSKLKSENFEKALKMESRELIKLENLEEELFEAKKKAYDKKTKLKKQKAKLEKIKEKPETVKENSEEYLEELRQRQEERLLALEEQNRIKKEEATRRRELKLLEKLKAKYEE